MDTATWASARCALPMGQAPSSLGHCQGWEVFSLTVPQLLWAVFSLTVVWSMSASAGLVSLEGWLVSVIFWRSGLLNLRDDPAELRASLKWPENQIQLM